MVRGNAAALDHGTSRYPRSWVSEKKKVAFDHENDIDLSRGGVYDPDEVDDLISWLEGNCRQEVVVHQLADQIGNLNPGQYITPKLMFPSYTPPEVDCGIPLSWGRYGEPFTD